MQTKYILGTISLSEAIFAGGVDESIILWILYGIYAIVIRMANEMEREENGS